MGGCLRVRATQYEPVARSFLLNTHPLSGAETPEVHQLPIG